MPTLITAQRGTDNQNTESRRTRDVSPALIQLEPDAGPLITLMAKLRKKSCSDPKFEWYEDELLPRQDILGAAATAAATTLTVTNYKYFRSGDIILAVETGEQMIVTATPSTTTVSVTRAWGDVSAAAITNSTKLRIIGNANEEGATKRSLLSTQREPKFNYTGIIRDGWSITNTAKATKTYAGVDFDEEAAKQLIEHKKHDELMFLQSQRYEDTTGTKPKRATRGFFQWVTTNSLAVGGDLTEPVFDSFLRRAFRYGAKTKFLLCSPIVAQAINGFAKDKLRVVDSAKTYGVTVNEYINAGRRVMLAEHNLMTNDDLNDFDGIAGMAGLIDLSNVSMRYMNGRLSIHNENIQANDADGREDEYLSEVGFQLELEKSHGEMSGVTG